MQGIRIDGIDKLREFAEIDLPKRVMAMARFVIREVVEMTYKEIVKAIPENERWLKEYKKSLQIFEIKPRELGKGGLGFVIGSRLSGDWSMVEADKMVVKFRAERLSPDSAIGEVLEAYSPFTVAQVPSLEVYGATTSLVRVRKDEIESVQAKNKSRLAELKVELHKAKATFRPGPAKVEGTIFFDMVFMVMQMELGWGDVKKQHWRPALRNVGNNIKAIYRDQKLKTIRGDLFKTRNVEWKKEAENKFDFVRLSDLEEFKEFQEKILP